jgi:hypothetical protein
VGARGERARGVKRGHRGHLEIIGNHTTKRKQTHRKKTNYKASAEESVSI